MRLVTGDVIQSIHTGNSFAVEYVSADGHFFILCPREGEKSRGYDMNDFKRSFVKLPDAAMLQLFGNSEHVSNRDELPGWIKCSERMPGIGTRVLICDVERSGVYEAIRFDGNRFNRFGCEIIADYWQPLPAAAPQQEPQ